MTRQERLLFPRPASAWILVDERGVVDRAPLHAFLHPQERLDVLVRNTLIAIHEVLEDFGIGVGEDNARVLRSRHWIATGMLHATSYHNKATNKQNKPSNVSTTETGTQRNQSSQDKQTYRDPRTQRRPRIRVRNTRMYEKLNRLPVLQKNLLQQRPRDLARLDIRIRHEVSFGAVSAVPAEAETFCFGRAGLRQHEALAGDFGFDASA